LQGNFPSDSLDSLKLLLSKSNKLVFLTGAGISKESGIPTFRGNDGLWKQYNTSQLASIAAFKESPQLVWDFYRFRQNLISKCKPNAAHLAISQIQHKKKDTWILTQNVDNLHRKAKSNNIIELHGNIFKTVCISCGNKDNCQINISSLKSIPICSLCKNILKPAVVLFGEPLPINEWDNAIKISTSCEIMFIIGTSLNVSPANYLPIYAKENNAVLIEINPERTGLSKYMDYTLNGPAAAILPQIYQLLD
jgi:NAD-dependent deacetylase